MIETRITVQQLCEENGGVPEKYARRYLRRAAKQFPAIYRTLATHVRYERWVWEKDSPAHREALEVFKIITKQQKWPSAHPEPQEKTKVSSSKESSWNLQVHFGAMFSKSERTR